MTQVSASLDVVTQQSGSDLVILDGYDTQAGQPNGVLKTNPNYNATNGTSYTVMYSLHVNQLMYDKSVKFADSIVNNQLDSNNRSVFPVNSLELKISWVDTAAIPYAKRKDYFTTTASVQTVVSKGDTTYAPRQMAMLGMHIVGVVENHPEFIWATFEHDHMAPNYNWSVGNVSSDEELLLFAKGTTKSLDGILYDMSGTTPVGPIAKDQAFDLYQYGVPRNLGGTPENNAMNTAQEELLNFNNIAKINTCVREKLASSSDVWANYFYNGSIWLNTDGLSKTQQAALITGLRKSMADAEPQSFARGSLNCANVTMETFTQTAQPDAPSINVGNIMNCFTCHHGVSFSPSGTSSPIYMSHLFNFYLYDRMGSSDAEIEALKTRRERQLFLINNLE
jgi:hypothetical protein